jgi:hypothetical protein
MSFVAMLFSPGGFVLNRTHQEPGNLCFFKLLDSFFRWKNADSEFFFSWIEVNTEYLSMAGSSTVQIVVATATAAANGQNIGDISVILPEGLASALTNSAEIAANACGATVKARKRDEANNRNMKRVTEAGKTKNGSK